MDASEEEALRARYAAYVDGFKADGSLHPHLELKAGHAGRVAEDSADIALDLGWPDADVRTARALGLVHDVGRFSQFAEFGTFSDRRSVDHGERGAAVLLDGGFLDGCSEVDRARILNGVRYHNAHAVPEGLAGDPLRFARLVRDADKLDIYRVVREGIERRQLGPVGTTAWPGRRGPVGTTAWPGRRGPVGTTAWPGRRGAADDFMSGLSHEAAASPAVVDCLRGGRMVPNRLVCGLADYLLLQAAWVYDVNYVPTMRRLSERRLLEAVSEHLPADGGVSEAVALAVEFRDRALAAPCAPGERGSFGATGAGP